MSTITLWKIDSYFKDFHASGACLYIKTGWCVHVKRNFNSLLSLVRLKLLSWRIYIQLLRQLPNTVCCTLVSAIPWLVKVIFPLLKREAGIHLFIGEGMASFSLLEIDGFCLGFLFGHCCRCFILFYFHSPNLSFLSKGKETKALCYATPSVMGPSLQLGFYMLLWSSN